MGIVKDILTAAGKANWILLQRLTWYKVHTPTTGTIPKYQNHMEDILIFTPVGQKLFFNWAENVVDQGSNMIVFHPVKHHTKDELGEIVNLAEKPWQIYFRMIRTHFREGNQVKKTLIFIIYFL